jgi:iron complex outermembrane recepter protein
MIKHPIRDRLLSLAALVAFALPAAVYAQGSVRGTVVDKQSGQPLVAATVSADRPSVSTKTNQAGEFTLSASEAITRITVSHAGYADQVVSVGAGEMLKVELSLTQSLPGVEVMAAKPAPAVGVLTADDINRFDGIDLVGAINTIPGVFMQTRTPFGGSHITLQGYYPSTSGNSPNSNGMGYQVFLNGIPVTDATGTTIMDDIDYSTLGKVEIIKGPASSIYGSFIGGTINLTTAQPTPNQSSLTQTVMGGNYDLIRTNTTFQHSGSDGSDFVLNYGHQGYNGFRLNDFSGKEYLRASGDFKVADNQTITTYFSYNRSNEGLAGEIDSTNFYARVPQSDQNYLFNDSHIGITSYYGGVSDMYRISDHFSNTTSLYGSARSDDQVIAHGYTDVGQFNFGGRTSFNYTGQWSGVGVSGALGGQFMQTNATSNGVFITPAPPYPERPSDSENYASNSYLFTEWNFTFPASFVATVGASYNSAWFATRNLLVNNMVFDTTALHQKSFANTVTPRFALTKTFDNNMSLYAGVSTGITPPLLSQIISNTGAVDLGLSPERAIQYEIGLQGSMFDKHLDGQIRLFDLDNTNKLVSETVSSVTQTINAGEQRNEGAELSLNWNAINDKNAALSLLRPWVTYTYTSAKYISFYSAEPTTAAGVVNFSGNQVARVPKTMYSIGLDAATHAGWYVNTTYQFVDKVPVTFDNSTWQKGYDLLSAKIGYKTSFSKYLMNIYIGGDNLTSSTYYTFLFVGPNYKGLAQSQDGGTGDGYILPAPYGPTFYMGMSLSYLFNK